MRMVAHSPSQTLTRSGPSLSRKRARGETTGHFNFRPSPTTVGG